jgi:uncharacterized protein
MSLQIRDAELREQLLKDNEEFRRLSAEHQQYDIQLEVISGKHFLTEEEELQAKTLKKKKLMLKDQMFSIVQKARKHLESE